MQQPQQSADTQRAPSAFEVVRLPGDVPIWAIQARTPAAQAHMERGMSAPAPLLAQMLLGCSGPGAAT